MKKLPTGQTCLVVKSRFKPVNQYYFTPFFSVYIFLPLLVWFVIVFINFHFLLNFTIFFLAILLATTLVKFPTEQSKKRRINEIGTVKCWSWWHEQMHNFVSWWLSLSFFLLPNDIKVHKDCYRNKPLQSTHIHTSHSLFKV